ncbi:MAG: DUF3106 domain-containing protein [Cytophagales bacterium]|nr:DUF3106 domain-containing protein [Rhizobacter sp.]
MLATRLVSPTRRESARRNVSWMWFAVALMLAAPHVGFAQGGATTTAPKASPQNAEGVSWTSLSPSQKNALRPLEREWGGIDGTRKTKWLEIANKFPSMPRDEQARIQTRMEDWAKLTPRERGQARMNFKEAQQVPAQERKDKWEAYRALPPEQQKQFAARAAPATRKAPTADPAADAAGTKSNVVPNSSYAPRPKAVAPTVAQARPGATTNLITKQASPPAHQPAGLPKIAVTPGFVDQSTLLPKRGPQGAATRSAAASTPAAPRP